MLHFFRKADTRLEYCFNIETSSPLTTEQLGTLRWLLSETFEQEWFGNSSLLGLDGQGRLVEVGPRMNFETAWSTNAVAICHKCGLTNVTRIERSRRYALTEGANQSQFIAGHHDRMTECYYPEPLQTFETGIVPAPVRIIPLIEEGKSALARINRELGLGMDEWDINYYHDLFVNDFGRNPTDVECFQLGQANSEHSRHHFFRGKLIIDGEEVPETLLDIIMDPWRKNPGNSVIAFKDNSSAIKGYEIWTIIPQTPGKCSPFGLQQVTYHLLFTAETHNFPSGVAPFPGAETGTGGRIRDDEADGKGSQTIAGTAGYCAGNLNLPDYPIPGENPAFRYPGNLASPIKVLIGESNGTSDYGNKIGEPVIQGFTRTFGQVLPNGERREWVKPIEFTGGMGQIDDRHLEKKEPRKGMLIVQIGGPAYRIGVGGGSASSMISGENIEELDFNAVQRGDAEMENKANRVIRACVEMGDKNPILAIHDQGAGGPCNVLTELVNPAGGRVEIRKIKVGDQTMSVLEIWGAEYQERYAFLIWPDRISEFLAICERENVNCEILGEITGDGRIVVHDSQDDSIPVDLELSRILGKMPQKTFHLERIPQVLAPLSLPSDLTVKEALRLIFRLPSVGSKGFLVHKVDRSVTGLIARQQCCGPLQLPVSDVAVAAQSHFGLTGGATAIGEQPIMMLVNPAAGARRALGEALTNLVWVKISDLPDIKCSVNWMWPAKLPGEGARLYDAALATREIYIKLGIAPDGGKDSLAMAAKVLGEMVKAPGQMVISVYVTVPDITKVVTPDLKKPGESKLMFVNLAPGKNRLGGTVLAQAFGQIGDECPDLDNPELLSLAFQAVQQLIEQDLILAGHDRSDDGLITTLCEMAMSGNCGMSVNLPNDGDPIDQLFSGEMGLVMEYSPEHEAAIIAVMNEFGIPFLNIGETEKERQVVITCGSEVVLDVDTPTLLNWWESTSDRLEQEQMNPELAKELALTHDRKDPTYHLTFEPQETAPEILKRQAKPKVAIIREEGTNGDREMTSAFFAAGFEPWDVNMDDLLKGVITLEQFRGVVFPGGFSYADVLDAGKGWAAVILFHQRLREMFERFFHRPDTFSLGICNGCQLEALLGWVPWRGIPIEKQPRFIRNRSEKFESRWPTVRIRKSPAIMLQGMEGSTFGVWVDHGEGYLHFPDRELLTEVMIKNLAPIVFVDDNGESTEQYPYNPNGSPLGITALCSPDGRHLAMMPHPERVFRLWQWPWMPLDWKTKLKASPWLKMFQNAREWCDNS